MQGQLSVLSVQNGCKLNFVGFQRVLSVLCRFLPLQFKNPSYVTDSLKSLSVSSCPKFFSRLEARDKCWNHANVFQVHPKDAQFVKVIQTGIDRWTSVVPYIISQL